MRQLTLIPLLALVFTSPASADETPAKSQIASVSLFKNGLAVVRRTVSLPGPGSYRLDDVPEPVHGTWWIESPARIETRVTTREIESPIDVGAGPDFQTDLVGRNVTIYFRDGTIPSTTGRVAQLAPADPSRWDRTYQQPQYYYGGWYGGYNNPQPSLPSRFLILDTDAGRIFVDPSMIAYLQANQPAETIKRRRDVLVLEASSIPKGPVTISISYLAKGIAWAPSYRVDLADSSSLSIEQSAVIKNELEGLKDAEIKLITGFPSIQFAHVTSPLSLRTTWAGFFGQLNQRFQDGSASMVNVQQQARMYEGSGSPPTGIDLAGLAAGEGVDLHEQSVGKRSLAEGDSLSLTVADARAEYERVVEWLIPDTRTANGQYINDYERQQNPDKYDDAPWDAVRFRNPFQFPMTTAAAMIVSGERFVGQRMATWTNPGESITLRITKALSVRTRSAEQEEPGERNIVYIGGNDFRKTTVKGELVLTNFRKTPVTICVRRQFSGDLLAADDSPTTTLREEGVYSVNRRNELNWTITLQPAQEKTITYRYSVLVDN